MRLAILTSHPIQYQTPFFKTIAQQGDIDPHVFFCWDFGVRSTYDSQFGVSVQWDISLLDGFTYEFLSNLSPRPSSGFWGQINIGIIQRILFGRFDAVLVYGWNGLTNWLAFAAAFLSGTPIILHGESTARAEMAKVGVIAFLKKCVLRTLFKYVTAFLYLGRENLKFYTLFNIPKSKLYFTPYAVDNDRFMELAARLLPKRTQLRKDRGLTEADVCIIFVGKLIQKKRPLDLLHAFAKMRVQGCHLFFIGDGELRQDLEQEIDRNTITNAHIVGFVNQSQLPLWYAIADVFVLPSGDGETWGLVANEAACFSVPLLVSDKVGCVGDIVRDSENGFVFESGNSVDCAEKLERLCVDSEQRKKFGGMSRVIVSGYSHSRDHQSLKNVLQSLTHTA